MRMDFKRVADAALALQAEQNDPLCAYIYDLDALREHVQTLMADLPPQCELFYAAKANPEPAILQAIAGLIDGVEVASGGELQWLRENAPPVPLIFGGPGKLQSELHAAVGQGVELIHVESLLELERLEHVARATGRPVDLLLRLNLALEGMPTTSLTMGGRPTPFGLDVSELEPALEFLRQCPGLRLRGFHFHMLSHQLDADAHLKLLQAYFRQAQSWRIRYGLDIRHLNVGGGIGINYRQPDRQFDWPRFSRGLASLIQEEGMQDWTVRFELGRYVTAACGYYVMEVMDIKRNHGQWFAVARGGTHHFRTPAAQGHSHPFRVIKGNQRIKSSHSAGPVLKDAKVTLVGQLCTPKDVMATEVPVDRLAVGDLLLFPYAGAYAWNISHQGFLRHPGPECLYLDATRTLREAG